MENKRNVLYKNKYYEAAIFREENIKEAALHCCDFTDCEFVNCTFEDCRINECKFTDCKFQNCTIISLKSKDSELRRAEFFKCNLIGIHWNELLPTAKISEPIYRLQDCHLKYNSFFKISLKKFDFSENTIQESVFEECSLMDASFKNCRLEGTQISGCDIRNADFRDSIGYEIEIVSNKMKGARFSFPEVVNLLNSLEIKID